jgi:hypothetical protein
MKIVRIFDGEDSLFAFHYAHEEQHELDRLLELWQDTEYLRDFAKSNGVADIDVFVLNILDDAEKIDDLLLNESDYEFYFHPLELTQHNKSLSLRKGKVRLNKLRLYAIKIDQNCFAITGGAIKMSQKMADHPDTRRELEKLKAAQMYLRSNDVHDADSFVELLDPDT